MMSRYRIVQMLSNGSRRCVGSAYTLSEASLRMHFLALKTGGTYRVCDTKEAIVEEAPPRPQKRKRRK
jgi:hypothetical protein